MSIPTSNPGSTRKALNKGSLYYGVFWGFMAISFIYMSVDLTHRGVSQSQWGILSAVRALIIVLAAPAITRRADKKHKRVEYLRWSLMLVGTILLLFSLRSGFPGFFLLMVLLSLANAPLIPLGDGIIVRMARNHKLEFGRMRFWGSFGFGITGFLGGILWQQIGFSYLYVVSFFGAMLASLLAGRLEEPTTDLTPEQLEELEDELEAGIPAPITPASPIPVDTKPLIPMLMADSVLLIFLLVAFLRAAANNVFMTFNAIYVDSLTGNGFFTGLVAAGASLLEIPVMFNSQSLIRRFGLERSLFLGILTQTAGFALFSFSTNPWMLFLGQGIANMGFALYFVSSVQFVDFRAGEEDATSYQGILNSVGFGLAALVSGPLSGLVYQYWGARTAFILATVLCGISALLMIPVYFQSRHEKQQAQTV